MWYGVDGNYVGSINFPTNSNYNWGNQRYNSYGPSSAQITISSAGEHTVVVWARENGFRFDGFYISKSSSLPSGAIPSGASVVDPTDSSGGGGGANPLDACLGCHGDRSGQVDCNNSAWTMHNGPYVDQTTFELAETTYLGSLCGNTGGGGNLALNASADASRDSSEAPNATDGDMDSSWRVSDSDREELYIDLGSRQDFNRVVIEWDNYDYADDYRIEVSNDNDNWTRIYDSNENGNGNTDEISFSTRNARYIMLECRSGNGSNYEVFEFEVYAQ